MSLITEDAAKQLTFKPFDIYRFWIDKEHKDPSMSWVGVFKDIDATGAGNSSVKIEIQDNYPLPLENDAHVICFKDL
jgi:hypothetical protein